jgi:hypothetical protein
MGKRRVIARAVIARREDDERKVALHAREYIVGERGQLGPRRSLRMMDVKPLSDGGDGEREMNAPEDSSVSGVDNEKFNCTEVVNFLDRSLKKAKMRMCQRPSRAAFNRWNEITKRSRQDDAENMMKKEVKEKEAGNCSSGTGTIVGENGM